MKRDEVPPLTLSRDSVGDTFRLLPRVDAWISLLRERGGGFAIAPSTPSPPAAHKQIRIEKSSHKTHLIQPIRRVRCVSYAKYATEKGRHTRRYTTP